MLNLSKTIRLTRETLQSPNLTDRFPEGDLDAIGNAVWEGYNRDRFSRLGWETRMQAAMDLAMQVQKDKNFPWPGCSNVAFPLITIAALQFHSRAYPAIIQGPNLVRYRVNTPDQKGERHDRALRVGKHMSYQLLEQNPSWEEQHDRLLINLPIVGCAFVKTRFDRSGGYPVGELVLAQDLVLDYFAKSVEGCMRKTHILPTFRNDIHSGILTRIYRDIREREWYQAPARPLRDQSTEKEDRREGRTPPPADDETPFTLLEQHVRMDLDGDGYAEPYIITIEEASRTVLRIVTAVDRMEDIERTSRGEIIRVRGVEYFTKYSFIPSPDGSVYDMGFGVLLGPLNESVNSLLNQLVDAGTMSNTAGGFLGRGIKIRGGVYTFAPNEWKRVDSTGDDLRKSIVPLPVRDPSNVLFTLLDLLINYTNRISGSTDTMVGENPGQNTPASTTRTMVEQGMKVYSSIFKRVWRGMKEEFRKIYILNGIYLDEQIQFGNQGEGVSRQDYLDNPAQISPVADPNVTSAVMRMEQAAALKAASMSAQGYNLEAVEKNYLQALHIDEVELFYPGPGKVPPLPNPKISLEQVKQQAKMAHLQFEMRKWQVEALEEHRLNTAKILQLEAQAAKFIEEAGGVKTGHQIAAFEAMIGALKQRNDALLGHIDRTIKMMEMSDESAGQSANPPGMGGLARAPGNQGPQGSPSSGAGAGQGGMGAGGLPG